MVGALRITWSAHLWSSMLRESSMVRTDLVDSDQRDISVVAVTNTVIPLRMSKSLTLDGRSKSPGSGSDSVVMSIVGVVIVLGRRCAVRLE